MNNLFTHFNEYSLIFMMLLFKVFYDKLMCPRGLEERFAFLAPNTVNAGLIVTKPDDVISYVLGLFMVSKDT